MSNQQKGHSRSYSLDQLKEGDEGPIVVMICRRWDVHNINGRYLSTDFIVSDEKENVMHCTMKSNISHCFNDKVQEGSVVSMRYFSVQKKDEYRIIKDNTYLIELNGSTSIRKATVNVGCFVRHPFRLMDFENIQPTERKYSIPRTGSKNLDFILSNERGRTIRVTLWGKLGDTLLKKKPNNCGNYTIILTSMSAKYYNGQLCLSSCSSTLILDNDEIPAIVAFKEKVSDVDETESSLPVVASEPQHGTIEELLACGRDKRKDATTFIFEVEIINVRTKNSWYYPACAGGKCKKGVTRKDGKLWCDACDQPVNYPKPRFRLEVDVKDSSAHTVIVMWDETATELTKSSAKALLDGLDECTIRQTVSQNCAEIMAQDPWNDVSKNPSLSNMLHTSIIIHSNTNIRPDGRVQAYCGLKLTNTNTEQAGTSGTRPFKKLPKITSAGLQVSYHNPGPPATKCPNCHAYMWREERSKKANKTANPTFSMCCQDGKVRLPKFKEAPATLSTLLDSNDPGTAKFREQIRVYNGMFCFTSFGGKIRHSINQQKGPYTFRINGQNYHKMGSLIPAEGANPKFAQLYFFDTQNEVSNRMSAFTDNHTKEGTDETIIRNLTHMLNQFSSVAKAFRMARDWCDQNNSYDFQLRLLGQRSNSRQYNTPSVSEVAVLVTNDCGDTNATRDIIVNNKTFEPERISELHPSYMALQYPLLFIYGEDGFHEEIPYHNNSGKRKMKRGFLTMREYYCYVIQYRDNEGTTLLRGGCLFQQFLVDAYTSIEEQRLRWTRNNQDDLRVDLYHNLYDAVTRGDTKDEAIGEFLLRLVNLRFFVVDTDEHLPRIPSAVSFLWNLQTLVLYNMGFDYIFEFWKMPQLRHVITYEGTLDAAYCLSGEMNGEDEVVLENLQTLFVLSNLNFGVGMLRRIPNIKTLKLYYNRTSSTGCDYCVDNLQCLQKLEVLGVRYSFNFQKHLGSELSFPYSLKKLTLEGTRLPWEDMETMIGWLPLLQVLKLKKDSFIGYMWETFEGRFPSLKFLMIDTCDLEDWTTDNTHFPLLEHLVLRSLRWLGEIPLGIGEIPTLRSINLENCNHFVVDSA
ncbi:hypothetical protein OROHE_008477 [Orobanche hederae]